MVGKLFGGMFGGKGSQKEEPYQQAPEQTERLIKALQLLAGGDVDAAIAELDAAVENDPADWMSLQNRGSFHMQAGHFDQAVADLSEVLRLNPKNSMASFTRGQAYHEMGELRLAEEDFSRVVGSRSGLPDVEAQAYLSRGMIRQDTDRLKEAFTDYSEAIAIDSTLSEKNQNLGKAYANRGMIFLSLNEHQRALDDLTVAVERDPGNGSAHGQIGLLLSLGGYHEEAIRQLDFAIELEPTEASHYRNRGGARLVTGQLEGALSDLDMAIDMGPPEPGAFGNRATVRNELGDWEGALEDYSRSIELAPDGAAACYVGRAVALRRLGRIEESDHNADLAVQNGYDESKLAQIFAEHT